MCPEQLAQTFSWAVIVLFTLLSILSLMEGAKAVLLDDRLTVLRSMLIFLFCCFSASSATFVSILNQQLLLLELIELLLYHLHHLTLLHALLQLLYLFTQSHHLRVQRFTLRWVVAYICLACAHTTPQKPNPSRVPIIVYQCSVGQHLSSGVPSFGLLIKLVHFFGEQLDFFGLLFHKQKHILFDGFDLVGDVDEFPAEHIPQLGVSSGGDEISNFNGDIFLGLVVLVIEQTLNLIVARVHFIILHELGQLGVKVVMVDKLFDDGDYGILLNCSGWFEHSWALLTSQYLYTALIIENAISRVERPNCQGRAFYNTQINGTQIQCILQFMDSSTTPPPTLPLLPLLQRLLQSSKQAISLHSPVLPLFSFNEQLDPNTMSYSLAIKQQFILNTATLAKFARLLEIVAIVISNIRQGKSITKRNLYYKLEHYYNHYGALDKDIKFICHNLHFLHQTHSNYHIPPISKNMLGIIASNRCIMFGDACVSADGRFLSSEQQSQLDIITIPTCTRIVAKSKVKKILIIEKESFFYELVTAFKRHHLTHQYLLISARGYPDQNTRELLLDLCSQSEPQIEAIYYLGDYDAYGFDIFLFYALGDWSCRGILSKIVLLEIGRQSEWQKFRCEGLKEEMSKFTREDDKKVKEVSAKLDKVCQQIQKAEDPILGRKMERMRNYFEYFVKGECKCELQLFNEYALHPLWVHEMIKEEEKRGV